MRSLCRLTLAAHRATAMPAAREPTVPVPAIAIRAQGKR
jgi:hypothetical protein